MVPARWEETENSHGEQCFHTQGFCFPSAPLTLLPSPSCCAWGRWEGGGAERVPVSGRTSGHLLLGWTAHIQQNGGSWSPFQGIILLSKFQLCRGDQSNVICVHCPSAQQNPLAFSLSPIIHVPTFAALSRILVPGSSENQLLFMAKMLSPFPSSSLPSAFSHCHFNLD